MSKYKTIIHNIAVIVAFIFGFGWLLPIPNLPNVVGEVFSLGWILQVVGIVILCLIILTSYIFKQKIIRASIIALTIYIVLLGCNPLLEEIILQATMRVNAAREVNDFTNLFVGTRLFNKPDELEILQLKGAAFVYYRDPFTLLDGDFSIYVNYKALVFEKNHNIKQSDDLDINYKKVYNNSWFAYNNIQ